LLLRKLYFAQRSPSFINRIEFVKNSVKNTCSPRVYIKGGVDKRPAKISQFHAGARTNYIYCA